MMALMVAATVELTFTAPCAQASVDSCAGGPPEASLASMILQRRLLSELSPVDRYTFAASGLECQPVTWSVPSAPVAYWSVVAVDSAGNRSCSGKEVLTAPPPVGVPPVPVAVALRWYDIAGRKLDRKPTMPGIYFTRRAGQRAARVVVLR